VLAEYEALMAETRSQAQDVLRQAKEEMAAQSARQQQELADKITRSASDAETRIDKARQDALANIREIAIDVARDATKRLIDTEVEPAEAEAAVDSARGGRG
jgi:F-type H+-transporting ATPase subunit b